jgi:hypothetical protein
MLPLFGIENDMFAERTYQPYMFDFPGISNVSELNKMRVDS